MDDLIKNDIEQPYQQLFDYLSKELNVIALQTQMQDIETIVMSKNEQKEHILQFLYDEITERRDYSASKMCEKVIEFIQQLK